MFKKNQTLMIQGTTSDAGKSVLVTGICRVLKRRGISVAPFKAQNMALNSAVTIDGGEIGRAQAVQAQACMLEPHTDMNPVLLKPNSDIGAQVIIHGKAIANMNASSYHHYKTTAMQAVLASHQRLTSQYQVIVAEGAGSPAEINLRDNDIANMGFAETVDCPVILVSDIDRGGVFAHIVGTLELLSPSEQSRIVGVIINRFRGDIALLQSGLDWLTEKTQKPVIGVVPYIHGFHLEAEDAINQQQTIATKEPESCLTIVVPALPHISNHTDFDPLRLHPQVDLIFVGPQQQIPAADLIIIPGSKNVRDDLVWLRKNGWQSALMRHCRYHGKLLGICGGYQMLGHSISDPTGIEGDCGTTPGFALLDVTTILQPEKQLRRVTGTLCLDNSPVIGYEIHAGITQGPALSRPLVSLEHGDDGAISSDNQVAGTYLHGLFDHHDSLASLLQWAGLAQITQVDYVARREAEIDKLADVLEEHLDLDFLVNIISQKLP